MTTTLQKPINQIVDDNYVNAYVLDYFGISFFDYSDKTLEQVCKEKGLKIDLVLNKMESLSNEPVLTPSSLNEYPVDLVIEYLKHMHHKVVKETLTYISSLIKKTNGLNLSVIDDLKIVFPLFVQDFIEHIYEEEDNYFNYIMLLNKVLENGAENEFLVKIEMDKHSLKEYANDHHQHENVMSGLRNITNNYEVYPTSNLQLKLIYSALQKLETDLLLHARIEDEVLFPKALDLENKVRKLL